MKRFIRLLLIVISANFIGVFSCAVAQELPKKITLSSTASSKDADVSINVLREAYSRIGIVVEIQYNAGRSSLQKSNAGEVAGEVSRIDGIADQFPNLVQVPIPINYFDIAVFSNNRSFKPKMWRDLLPYPVGILRGQLAAEQATRELRTREADTYAELFHLLEQGEVDFIVTPLVVPLDYLHHNKRNFQLVRNAIFDSYLLYHYLHKNYAYLIPLIQPVLRDMLRDGTTVRIRDATYADLPKITMIEAK
jgi:polar amino acid transport system substrate-binding protein